MKIPTPPTWLLPAGLLTAGLAAGFFFAAWEKAKEDLVEAIERCNTEKAVAVAQAERITRDYERAAFETTIAELEQMAKDERQAREVAEKSRILAEGRANKVRTVIREVSSADPDACLNADVPPAIVERLRDNDRDRETGAGGGDQGGEGACTPGLTLTCTPWTSP